MDNGLTNIIHSTLSIQNWAKGSFIREIFNNYPPQYFCDFL
jgi:hypothetical protein